MKPAGLRNLAVDLWQLLRRFGARRQLAFSEGNEVRLLLSGGEILEGLRALIDQAEVTIHFEIYAWADDATGRGLLAALKAARDRGVQVRGIVDHFGSWEAGPMIAASGLEVLWYHSLGWNLPWRRWARRNHRKLLLADGARAIVASANWTNEYNDAIPPKYYRDLGLQVQGPALEQLEMDFRVSWKRMGGAPPAVTMAPPAPAVGPEWHCEVPIQIVSSLNGGGRTLRRHLFLIFKQLRISAVIGNAYFIPDPAFLRVLLRMMRRGVQVDLIAPGDSDHVFVRAASRATFGRLLQAGVRIWERRGRVFHAKVAVLDEDLVLVGTANLDAVSFRYNLELNLLVRSRTLGSALRKALEEDQAQSSLLSPETWHRQPAWRRLLQRFAYLFWRWL